MYEREGGREERESHGYHDDDLGELSVASTNTTVKLYITMLHFIESINFSNPVYCVSYTYILVNGIKL